MARRSKGEAAQSEGMARQSTAMQRISEVLQWQGVAKNRLAKEWLGVDEQCKGFALIRNVRKGRAGTRWACYAWKWHGYEMQGQAKERRRLGNVGNGKAEQG